MRSRANPMLASEVWRFLLLRYLPVFGAALILPAAYAIALAGGRRARAAPKPTA